MRGDLRVCKAQAGQRRHVLLSRGKQGPFLMEVVLLQVMGWTYSQRIKVDLFSVLLGAWVFGFKWELVTQNDMVGFIFLL